MTVNISSSEERILQEAVNSGLYKDAEEALREALFLLRDKTATNDGNVLFRRYLAGTIASASSQHSHD